jgi:hypothetical protein
LRKAFIAGRLDLQPNEQVLCSMGDCTRNRFEAAQGQVGVSRFFDWYGVDFTLGH